MILSLIVIVSGEDTLVTDRRNEFKRFVDGQTHRFVLTPITDGQMQYLSRLEVLVAVFRRMILQSAHLERVWWLLWDRCFIPGSCCLSWSWLIICHYNGNGMVRKVHGVDAKCFLLGLVVRSSLLVLLMWQMHTVHTVYSMYCMRKEYSNEWLGTLLSGTDRHVLVCLYETY